MCWPASAAEYPFEIACTIRGAVSADTLALRCGIVSKTLRLDTIDGPEIGQPFGDTAASIVGAALAETPVTVTVRGEAAGTWNGSARLAGGWDLGTQLVSLGMAWPVQGSKNPQMAGLLLDAQKARMGLWYEGSAIAPWDWRRQHPQRAAPPAEPAKPVVITDDNLVRGDWRKFEAEGSKATARFWQQESQLRREESLAEHNNRMRYLESRLCYLTESKNLNFCLLRVERRYPVESSPTKLSND